MCQPKPGPRCAANTSAALAAAELHLTQATRDHAAAVEASHAMRGDSTLREQVRRTTADLTAARAAREQAQQDHDATRTGQQALREQIATMAAAADTTEHREVIEDLTVRLHAGEDRREQALADLAASRAQRARIENATEAERDHLELADHAVTAAENDMLRARGALVEAENALHPVEDEHRAVEEEYSAAMVEVRRAERETVVLAEDAAREAKALYVAAGISPRMAEYYAADMVDAAREVPGRPGSPSTGGAVRALAIKVKRGGTDRAATLAAQAAAQSDDRFIAANARLTDSITEHTAARERLSREVGKRYHASLDARMEAARTLAQAREALTDTENRYATVTGDRDRLYARVGAGIGAGSVRLVNLSRAGDEIVRNPDGTTNAYVYRGESPGFPYGRMARATGVTTRRGWAASNALTLEDGTTVVAAEHRYRSSRGAQRDSVDPQVILTDPADGALPLRTENLASAGFSVFSDSTD